MTRRPSPTEPAAEGVNAAVQIVVYAILALGTFLGVLTLIQFVLLWGVGT